jgi:hypothetical protein
MSDEYFCRGCGQPVWRKDDTADDVHQLNSPGPDYHRVKSMLEHHSGVNARLKSENACQCAELSAWTLWQGLEFIRKYQDYALHNGFNLSLGGGVLNKGESWHDLDVVIAPARGCTGENITTFLNWFMHDAGLREEKRSRWNLFMTLIATKDRELRKIDLFVVNGAGGVIPPPDDYQKNLARLAAMPPPTAEEVDQQMKSAATRP